MNQNKALETENILEQSKKNWNLVLKLCDLLGSEMDDRKRDSGKVFE